MINLAKWNRETESDTYRKLRIKKAKAGLDHETIDREFEEMEFEKLSYAELRERERALDRDRESFEVEKKAQEKAVQETKTELANLESEIKLKRQIVDETNLNTSLRKLNFFMKKAQPDFEDMTLVAFLYLENGKWVTKYFPIKKNQQTVVLETCETLRREAVGDS